MAVRSVGGTGPRKAPAVRKPRAKPAGPVLRAARKSLAELDSGHPLAGLLMAAAERLARDVDEAAEVRDRVAATRALVDLGRELDAAPPPAPLPGSLPLDDDEDEDGERGEAVARDDPFDIGDLPPGLGDAEAS